MRAQENRSTIEADRECSSVRERLAGYLDGALPSREHGRLGEHLEHCEDCRHELQRYRELGRVRPGIELGRQQQPTIANGRLYLRHGDTLAAYDLTGK